MLRVAVFSTLLGVLGCNADETVAAYGAADRTWVLQEIGGTPFTANATMTFGDDGAVSGRAPCNTYSGQNTVPYPWFKLGPVISTKMACPDLDQEDLFFQSLEQMQQSEVLGDVLILRSDDGAEMVFGAEE